MRKIVANQKHYTVEQLQLLFNKRSPATIYNWMAKGVLPYHQVGNTRFVTDEDYLQFLDNCKPTNNHSKTHSN